MAKTGILGGFKLQTEKFGKLVLLVTDAFEFSAMGFLSFLVRLTTKK